MTFQFRKAVGSEAKPLVGLYAESGCGKTKSALLLARGFTGDMSQVGMIETEAGRGEAYASEPDVGGYNVLPLRESFSPRNYGEAIRAAEDAKLRALIIDSASHEWEGVDGVLAMAAANQEAGKKGPLVWQRPKIEHAREFMLRLLQTPIPLVIVCMRARYPMTEDKQKREWVRSTDLTPKQSEDILFEMFVHGWIDKEHRFHGTKYTVDSMRKVFVDGEPISIATGERLAAWSQRPSSQGAAPSPAAAPVHAAPATEGGPAYITPDQVTFLGDMLRDNGLDKERFLAAIKVPSLALIPADKYAAAKARIEDVIEKRRAAARAVRRLPLQ